MPRDGQGFGGGKGRGFGRGGDRPFRREGGDRPARPFGDKPGFRKDGPRRDDRPARPYGDKPTFRKDGAGDRPFNREGGDRPFRREGGDRPFRREGGDRPFRPYGEKPPFRRDDRPSFRKDGERSFQRDSGDRAPRQDRGDRPVYRQNPNPVRDERTRAEAEERRRRRMADEAEVQESAEANAEDVAEISVDTGVGLQEASAAKALSARDLPPWFRKLQVLTTDKGREREGRFLAEGLRCVLEMIQHHPELVDGIYWRQGSDHTELLAKCIELELRTHDLEPDLFDLLTATVTSQGILAVCRSASTKPVYETARTLTLVDAIQDPGNLGALFRTSLAFAMDGMLLGKGSVDPFNPKVVRGSSGTFLREPFETGVDLEERIEFLRRKGFTIVATSSHAKGTLDQIPGHRLRKVALLVGNEGSGAEERLMQLADELVKIPMSGEVESLNVSVAHGVLSFQILSLRK